VAATSVTNIRTVFLNVLLRILAVLGLRTPQRPAVPAAVPVPGSGSPASAAHGRGACAAPAFVPGQRRPAVPRSPLARERSLPPTIKQRIRAEAHGSSPSVRRVPCFGEDDLTALLTT
jgi:Family of unknown function (DUF6344)